MGIIKLAINDDKDENLKIRYIKKVNSFWSQIRQKKIHTYSNFSSKDLQKIEFFKKLLSEKNNFNKG